MAVDSGNTHVSGATLIKNLAACNKTTRDRAVRLLRTWLSSQEDVPEEEMKKIWKGLFYCVWHSDKQPSQIELSERLSSLLVTLPTSLSFSFFEIFVLTIRREWSGIDYLRLDKFYLLIRRFLNRFFDLLKGNDWDDDLLGRFVRILEEKSLLSEDKFPAPGVNYHLAEIFLSELKGFLPLQLRKVEKLLSPFFRVMELSSDKILVKKIRSGVFDVLLSNGWSLVKKHKEEREETGDLISEEEKNSGVIGLKLGLANIFLNSASAEMTLQANRKVLFSLHEGFAKLEKAGENLEFGVGGPLVKKVKVKSDNELDGGVTGNGIPEKTELTVETEVQKNLQTTNEADDESLGGSEGKKSNSKESSKKKKKKSGNKKVKSASSSFVDSSQIPIVNDENANPDSHEDPDVAFDLPNLNETLIANLRKQFEMVAQEAGMSLDDVNSDAPANLTIEIAPKKRKRTKSAEKGVVSTPTVELSTPDSGVQITKKRKKRKKMKSLNGDASTPTPVLGIQGASESKKTGESSKKRVRFSMKNNLFWNSQAPLPPQSLRLPPSTTPRGSALKKGVPPGPVIILKESPSPKLKKVKLKSSMKKNRKGPKSVSAAKRAWKL